MASYYVRADGTVTYANRAQATSPNFASTSMSGNTFNDGVYQPGDIIYFSDQGGAYTTEVEFSQPGSAAGRLFYQAVDGETPTFTNSTGGGYSSGIMVGGTDYITIDGLRVSVTNANSSAAGILFRSNASDNITIKNTVIDMSGAGAVSTYGVRFNAVAATNLLLDSLTVSGSKSGSILLSAAGSGPVEIKNSIFSLSGASEHIGLTNVAGIKIGPNVTVSGDGHDSQSILISGGSGLLTIDGLTLTSTWPLRVFNSNFDTNSHITNLAVTSPRLVGIYADTSSGFDIYAPCTFASCPTDAITFAGGASHDITVRGCTADGGMTVYDGGYNILFEGNVVDGAASKGFMVQDASHDITFRKNILKNSGTTGSQNGGFNFHGTAYNILLERNLAINNKGYNYSFHDTTHGWMYHNLSTKGGAIQGGVAFEGGISVSLTAVNATTGTSWTIKNNVSYNDGRAGVPSLRLGPVNKDLVTRDYNAFYRATSPEDLVSLDDNGTRITWSQYHTSHSTYEPHSISADPKFVDPANGNYHLQSTSPLINAGVKP